MVRTAEQADAHMGALAVHASPAARLEMPRVLDADRVSDLARVAAAHLAAVVESADRAAALAGITHAIPAVLVASARSPEHETVVAAAPRLYAIGVLGQSTSLSGFLRTTNFRRVTVQSPGCGHRGPPASARLRPRNRAAPASSYALVFGTARH